jgi:hypothetical protein
MVKPIQAMDTTQDKTHSDGPMSAPQARPLTLQDIDNLLYSKVWTTLWDDKGETVAVHVEIKEGGDRYKYILGNNDKNEGCVLLSKQRLLTNPSISEVSPAATYFYGNYPNVRRSHSSPSKESAFSRLQRWHDLILHEHQLVVPRPPSFVCHKALKALNNR